MIKTNIYLPVARKVYHLYHKDLTKVTELITKTNLKNPLIKHIFNEKSTRYELSKFYWRYRINRNFHYGLLQAPDSNLKIIAAWMLPGKHHDSYIKNVICGSLKLSRKFNPEIMEKIRAYQRFRIDLYQDYLSKPIWNLNLFFLDKKININELQDFIAPMLRDIDKSGYSVMLETSDVSKISLYNKLGFDIIIEKLIPGSEQIHFSLIRSKQTDKQGIPLSYYNS